MMSDSAAHDLERMRSLMDGNDSALDDIVGIWEKPLFSFIFRYTQNEHTTQEILQETFVRIYTKRHTFKSEHRFSSWVFTIAANLCRNHSRWKKRHPESPLEPFSNRDEESGSRAGDLPADDAPSPEEEATRSEELILLREAVSELPHEMRTAMLLHHYEGLSYKEIGEIVACSPRGVETRLYRARKLLKRKLETVLEHPLRAKKKADPVRVSHLKGKQVHASPLAAS